MEDFAKQLKGLADGLVGLSEAMMAVVIAAALTLIARWLWKRRNRAPRLRLAHGSQSDGLTHLVNSDMARNPMVWVLIVCIPLAIALFWVEPPTHLGWSAGAGSREISGVVRHVRDGDTIEVNGTPVRFAKLDCAELGTPEGNRAKQALLELASGERVSCSLSGRKSYDRWVGTCQLESGEAISRYMIREGYCRRW
jgi:endonuclease YncB( thermonuclease family)